MTFSKTVAAAAAAAAADTTKSHDKESVSTTQTQSTAKKDWVTKWIQKMSQMVQTEENKKMIQLFLIDPILNHVLERIFPYILVLCVLFVVLTIMISLTLLLLFMRLPAAFCGST